MASTTALFTGLSGLTAHARSLDVIGNNIANMNTTAFKRSRMLFSAAFSRTLDIGARPNDTFGGANPSQIGLGVNVTGVQRDFRDGSLSNSGDLRDLALEGEGFFVVDRAGEQFFTRDGAFRTNRDNELVNAHGDRLRGFGVDDQFRVQEGQLQNLVLPIGSLSVAEATRTARFTGNLNTSGELPTQGTAIAFGALGLLGGGAAAAGSLLTAVENGAAAGTPLFEAGQTLRVTGASKGSRTIPTADLAVEAATTIQDLLDFLVNALGIDEDAGPNPDGAAPGATIDAGGVISIIGNAGAVNDLEVELSDLRLLDAAGNVIGQPLSPTTTAQADGESVRTTFVVYDSLGTPLDVNLAFVLESRGDSGTTWRYFAESDDSTGGTPLLGSGTVGFDQFGQVVGAAAVTVEVSRQGTGALDPLSVTLSLASDSDSITALADTASTLAATTQDGSPRGTLQSYSVDPTGVIFGAFSNGLTRTLGQVALASFVRPEGLVDAGSEAFTSGPASGEPVIGVPGQLGAGRIVSGALEQSNVDLSQEFINLILASTGYSASSRVITTADQLMQQLLVLGR